MLRTATDTRAAKKALVRTHDQPSCRDPWRVVQDYRRVQRAMADHPDEASSTLSSEVDLPRGRIRPRVDGDSKPDCLRGLETAQEHGWILDTRDDEQARPLITLAAWILASGSVDDTDYVPLFVADFRASNLVAILLVVLLLAPEYRKGRSCHCPSSSAPVTRSICFC